MDRRNQMNGSLGHDSARLRLYWAGDNIALTVQNRGLKHHCGWKREKERGERERKREGRERERERGERERERGERERDRERRIANDTIDI